MNSQRLEPQPSESWAKRQKRLDLIAYSVLAVGLANLAAGLTFLVLQLSK